MRFAPPALVTALVAFVVLIAQIGGAAASPGELSPAQRMQRFQGQDPSAAFRSNTPPRPALPGVAPNIPMPPASVMATTQGNPGTPAGAQASATASAPQLAPADESVLKKDSLTVEQLEGKMVASSDAYWQHQNRLHEFDLLRRYQAAQQVLEQTQTSAAASTAGAE